MSYNQQEVMEPLFGELLYWLIVDYHMYLLRYLTTRSTVVADL